MRFGIPSPSIPQDILGYPKDILRISRMLARLKAAHLLQLRDAPGQAQKILFLGVG
jgi:hypothetical protein